MKKIFNILLITVFLTSLLSGCKKDKGDPPTLPPAESFMIDFSNFEAGKKAADEIILPKGIEDNYWEFSAVVAGYFQSLLITTLAVPVASFNKALDQTPKYLEEKTWQWSYSITFLNITYKARLTGEIRTTDVLWNMFITREGTGGYAEFLWFDGTSKLDGTGGQWNLNHSFQHNEPLLKIEWTKSGNIVNYIKYTYVRTKNDDGDDDPFESSYIEYGKTTGIYDSYYNISYFNGLTFSLVNVEWHSVSHIGRVKCQPFFSDNLWHCWDGTLANTICP